MKSVGLAVSMSALVMAGAMPALAQVTPSVTGQTREEIERVAPPSPAQRPSRLTVDGGIERAPCPLAEPRYADVRITISAAQFNNLKMVSPDILRPSYESFIGREVPLAAVCEIRDAAATILRREGYLAAVQVPPQRIEGGVVQFDVLMAKLVAVRVRGDADKSESLIASYLQRMTGAEAFNERDAERHLLLARDLPGYDVRLTLKPAGTAPGEVIGEVTVQKIPFAIDASIQNYGSRAVGRWGGLIRGEAYDVLGNGDRATIGYYATPDFSEQHVLQLGYDMRLGSDGLTVGGRFTYAWAKPDLGNVNPGQIKSETLIANLEAAYPFIRTQSLSLRAAAGIDFINQDVELSGIPLSTDKLRVVYARLDFDAVDRGSLMGGNGYTAGEPRWRVAGSAELRQGLDILDATDCSGGNLAGCVIGVPTSRIAGEADATVIRIEGIAEYRPIPKLTLALAPRWQYSGDSLLAFEEFSAGNYTVGRGFDPGTFTGDSGAGFQAEVRYGRLIPREADEITVQPYVFYDAAWIWSHRYLGDPQRLESAGGGARFAYGDKARLDLTVAAPLRRLPGETDKRDVRLLMSLAARLWPWSR